MLELMSWEAVVLRTERLKCGFGECYGVDIPAQMESLDSLRSGRAETAKAFGGEC